MHGLGGKICPGKGQLGEREGRKFIIKDFEKGKGNYGSALLLRRGDYTQ
jgi:hypothetical protein